jgi:hypothetical protein
MSGATAGVLLNVLRKTFLKLFDLTEVLFQRTIFTFLDSSCSPVCENIGQ